MRPDGERTPERSRRAGVCMAPAATTTARARTSKRAWARPLAAGTQPDTPGPPSPRPGPGALLGGAPGHAAVDPRGAADGAALGELDRRGADRHLPAAV